MPEMRNHSAVSVQRPLPVLAGCTLALCVLAMLMPPLVPPAGSHRIASWIAGALLSGVVIVSTRWPMQLPLARGVLVTAGWLLSGVSAYLALVVVDLIGLSLAMPLSVAVLSLTAGQVGPRIRKALLAVHVSISGFWLGIPIVMVTLTILATNATDRATAHTYYALVELFDVTILPWSSVGTIMSGLAVSLTGKWGVVKHYWVLAKFLLAVLVLASAVAFLRDRVGAAVEDSALQAPGAGHGSGLRIDPTWLIVGFGYTGALLLAATADIFWRVTRKERSLDRSCVLVTDLE